MNCRRYLLLVLQAAGFQAVSAAQEKISSFTGFSDQRECAKLCFMYSVSSTFLYDVLGQEMGCGVPSDRQYKELASVDCYCRADLANKAHDWLTQCIAASSYGSSTYNGGCGAGEGSVDEQIAIRIYDEYCASVRGPLSSSASGTSGSGGSLTTAKGSTPTSSIGTSGNTGGTSGTSGSSGNNDNSSSGSKSGDSEDKGGLSKSDIIAIAVAIPSFIVACFGAWFGYKAVQKRRHRPDHGGDMAVQVPLQQYHPPQTNIWNHGGGGHQQSHYAHNQGHVWR
ncbi:hypothetical protein QBC43DRAFT_303740 [Cladorrhinum sp. PSN259]|nr:hypothetical protein QBC43DRAFT_303740 [Cladorrhinum sp. PSN259]